MHSSGGGPLDERMPWTQVSCSSVSMVASAHRSSQLSTGTEPSGGVGGTPASSQPPRGTQTPWGAAQFARRPARPARLSRRPVSKADVGSGTVVASPTPGRAFAGITSVVVFP